MKIIRDLEFARSVILKRSFDREIELPSQVNQRICEVFGQEMNAQEVVDRIIADVMTDGDSAVFKYCEKLDGVKLSQLEIDTQQILDAKHTIDQKLLESLELAAGRIADFHIRQRNSLPIGRSEFGQGVGQVLAPLQRVGVYAPGGTASYPSTVLMTAIPAKAAGVDEVILATPAQRDGKISPLTLAAASIAGVDRVFALGGAVAIGAMAYGTVSVPGVDKICGPGNIFVMLAKKKVFGVVDIDGLQGPTETVVLADDSANPVSCAADLLAQAEHDELSSAILITPSSKLAEKVSQTVESQLVELSRQDIARKSLERGGGIVVTENMEQAIELVNDYAPEHLCLLVDDPDSVVSRIRHAGGIFVGESSPEVLGDYVAGPSHVMPTGGTARFSSPLNVLDFLKVNSIVELDKTAFETLAPHARSIATAEGLTAHAAAVIKRQY